MSGTKSRKKKSDTQNRSRIIGILIIAALLVSTIGIFLSGGTKTYPLPSAQNFREEAWMSFVPADVDEFRFFNITKLSVFPGLLSPTVLSISSPAINVSISEVEFGVDVVYSGFGGVSVLGVGGQTISRISDALASSNATRAILNGVTIYQIPASNGSAAQSAWICVYNGTILYSEGETLAYSAIASIINSNKSIFSEDTYRVGYLLATGGNDCFASSYYKADDNQYNITWIMSAVSGGSVLEKRDVFSFPSRELASSQYSSVVKNLLESNSTAYLAGPYILASENFQSSDIRTALMSI